MRKRRGAGQAPRSTPYLFLTPGLVMFGVFSLLPIIASFVLSGQKVAVLGQGEWVGAGNYARMGEDPLLSTSLWNTLIFTVGTVPTSMALGILLAVLLNRALPGRSILRALYFLPMIASGVVVGAVMAWIFHTDYGVLDNLLAAFGLDRVPWLTSPSLAMMTLILAVIWTRVGFCMVIYLGALQSIPAELVEAATIDGAGPWRRFTQLTWPMLKPTTTMLVVINVVFSLQAFDLIYVLTGGGPGFATTVFIQYIFRSAFINGQMGYASALGVVFMLMLLGFTALRWRANRKAEEFL